MKTSRLVLAGVAAACVIAVPVFLALYHVPDSHQPMQSAGTVEDAIDLFKDAGFDPRLVGKGGSEKVPPVFLASLPGDMAALRDARLRKQVFVSIVLPLVLRANTRLRADRQRIEQLRTHVATGRTLRARDGRWLDGMAVRYRTRPRNFSELLRRVDIVPPQLAVAQAAQESGWGTSRFARTGNALFGQHAPTGSKPSDKTIAARQAAGVSMQAFDSLYRSVTGYMENLNSHAAYKALRSARATMRAQGGPIDAFKLVGALGAYSEEGHLYIERLSALMRDPDIAMARLASLAPAD